MAVDFRGSAVRLGLISGAYLTLTAAVGSYALLGVGWPRFFLVSFLLCALPIGGLCLLLLAFDRMVFDDEARVIRRPLRRPLSYDSVGGFHVHKTGGMASLTTAKGGPILLYSFDPSTESRLEQGMRQRWPDGVVTHSGSSGGWWLVALAALPLALAAAYTWSLEERFADIREPCTPSGWSMQSSGPRDMQIGPFAVGVPAGFTLRPGGTMIYGSETADIIYSLESPTSDAMARAVLQYGLGVRSSSGMIRWGACATNGVLPLTAKASLFGADSTERLIFEGGIAVLRQTELGGNALIAFTGPQGTDLVVTVNFEETIDNELLERIISLVGIGSQRLARRTD